MDVWLARLAGLDSGDILTWILWRNYKINGGENARINHSDNRFNLLVDFIGC